MSCNEPILLSTDPDDIAILEGPGVQSVNGKVGKVVLDAGDFAYDDTKEYGAGSVGAELKELSQKEIDVDSALSDTSTNPVQNKVVNAKTTDIEHDLTIGDLAFSKVSIPVVRPSDWLEVGVNTTTGELNNSNLIRVTRFFPIDDTCDYEFTGVVRGEGESSDRVLFNYFYNKDKEYIGRSSSTIVENAKFVRFGYGFASASGIRVDDYGFENLIADWSAEFTPSYIKKENETAEKLQVLYDNKADVIISTASGSIAHFEDGANADAVSVIAHIEPVQEGTGDPAPDNVRPITGRTGMDVHVSPTTDAQDGATYPITFPTEAGTVYGGYVDVTNGKLVVDMARVDMGTLNFLDALPVLTTGFAGRVIIPNRLYSADITEAYCDSYAFWGNGSTSQISSNIQNGQFAYQATNRYAWFRNDSYSTVEELKTSMSGVYLVYKLAEPIRYQLTPQQITTLLGINNIWNDANGETEVEYRADTKLYIEQLTKPTEDDMTANANIASGKFFMVGNRLFLSTAAIASGDTINPGTNCTELSLADALNNL